MTGPVELYRKLLSAYGPQHWWPAESAFEVIAGAVLTQNTAWRNVERAIDNLKGAEVLSAEGILALPPGRLAGLLRPSGFYRVKSERLRAVCRWLVERHGAAESTPTDALRSSLLAVHGVGDETADAILLYAFGRPVFVVDGYARRLFSRVGLIEGREACSEIKAVVEARLGDEAGHYNEFHALIVEHGKQACRKTPRCARCPIRCGCRHRHATIEVGTT